MTQQRNLSQQTKEAAKQLAPWRTGLPWWVVLIEGIVVAVVGLLVVLDPAGTNVTLVLFLSAGMAIAGLMQLWSVFRNQIPESVDSVVAARSAIAVYAGLAVVILYFIEGGLTRISGFGIFGTAALVYGLLALVQVFVDEGGRRQALIEALLFGGVGLITLWGLFAGGESIITAVRIIGWIFLIGGAALIGLAIWRWQKGEEADEMIDAATARVSGAADQVSSMGQSASAGAKQAAADAKRAAAGAAESVEQAAKEAGDKLSE
jgi:hypothetical protein